MFPERSDATRIAAAAQGPRLFGVPVPARAFGFAPGWQLSPTCWSTIDLRDETVAIRPVMRTMATTMASPATRGYGHSHRQTGKTSKASKAKETTTRVEVAAA